MKLYLSSQHIGSASHVLLEMIGDRKMVGIIANAIDASDQQHRINRLQREERMLNNLGLATIELDLRQYFGNSKALKDKLKQLGMVWIRGGNVYTLVRAMEQSGFSEVAPELIRNDSLVFGGYSAATIIAAPDLLGSELMDNPHELPVGYKEQTSPMRALGLLDHYVACHYESRQPWAKNVPRYIDYITSKRKDVLKLKDGEVYIVNGSNEDGYVVRREEDSLCT